MRLLETAFPAAKVSKVSKGCRGRGWVPRHGMGRAPGWWKRKSHLRAGQSCSWQSTEKMIKLLNQWCEKKTKEMHRFPLLHPPRWWLLAMWRSEAVPRHRSWLCLCPPNPSQPYFRVHLHHAGVSVPQIAPPQGAYTGVNYSKCRASEG